MPDSAIRRPRWCCPGWKNDIVDVFEACIDGTLDQIDLKFDDDRGHVCVVLASDGYPGFL